MSGPNYAGGVYQRNRTSWSFNPNQNIPAGAFLILALGCNLPDDTILTISDGGNPSNSFNLQVASQQPGTVGTLFVFLTQNAQAITTAQQITISSPTRGDLLATLFYYTGVQGSLYSTDVEWNAGSAPQATVNALAGMQAFAILAVAGPNNDGFTNDHNWGADLKPSISTVNATIHACGHAVVNADGPITYAPTLGSNRQNLLLVASFS